MTRERLPNRRAAETFDVEAGGLKYTATAGFYPDGRVGELFIVNHKQGSQAGILASDSAVAASLAMQHGASIDELRHALRRDPHGRPLGPLAAALDLVAETGHAVNAAEEVDRP
jgi:hypothetical protein